MIPTLCILGGCNGAGKTTLARELLPRLGLMRFLNADEIARGLSPLDPTLSAFRSGRLLLEEARTLIATRASFALESTLSGKTQIALIREAKARGYHILLHYVLLPSPTQAIDRVALRVKLGGHHVPDEDVRRRFDRSRRNFLEQYLPLADEWGLWDNHTPPALKVAGNDTHTRHQIQAMLESCNVREENPGDISETTRIVLEASRIATEKMLEHYKRMGIRVTPQMTLAKEVKPRRTRRGKTSDLKSPD